MGYMGTHGASMDLDRRGFVATAACAAGTVALAGAGTASASASEAGDKAVASGPAGSAAGEKAAAWDATYDVVVIGYGLAGGTAARHAADAGAKVLLIDGAPEGGEGGNTKFAKQLLASGHDVDSAVTYLKALNANFEVDDEIIRMFAEQMVAIPDYCKEYLGADVYSWRGNDDPVLAPFVPEYPELPGSEEFDAYTITEANGDGALWIKTQELIAARADSIDVWPASPARHLIRDAQTGVVTGAIIEHEGADQRVQATGGVVLACGGFEFNDEMLHTYLGVPRVTGIGTPYNTGDGIRMALEIGADLWHMKSYEPGSQSLMFDPGDGSSPLAAGAIPVDGSTIFVGSDGRRYFNELAENRHGRVRHAGEFRPVEHSCKPWFVWDQTRMDEVAAAGMVDAMPVLAEERYVKADTLEALAEACGMDPAVLVEQIDHWNVFAEAGCDYQFGRDPATLRAFDGGPYYAMPGVPLILNTQGGPRRNVRAEILDPNGEPIPHLYGAGELGSINAFQYQGGCNLSECLIFGRIAGENAAAAR